MKTKRFTTILISCLILVSFACTITPRLDEETSPNFGESYKRATLAKPVHAWVVEADGRKAGP